VAFERKRDAKDNDIRVGVKFDPELDSFTHTNRNGLRIKNLR